MRTLILLLALIAGGADAQQKPEDRAGAYPNRPVRIVVMVPAGGSVDSVTRAMAYPMSQHIGVSIVVDNRAGGTGTIALNILRQSAPDGYTLLSAGNTIIVTGVLGKVPFDLTTALEPVVQMTSGAYVVTVNAALPVSSLKELATYAKSKPNALSYGSPGIGSIIHLGTEQLAQALGGLRIVHVPYKGNSFAIVDLLAGRIELLLAAAGVANHIKSGKLKALAVTSRHRMQAFPDLPTLAEAGVQNVVLENAYGLYAPAGVPRTVVSTLNREVTLAMNSPEVRDKISADGAEPTPPHAASEFKASFIAQYQQWKRFIKTSNIALE
jgi:tripartite-type tricarboxylate transporter receptor subunit TctC